MYVSSGVANTLRNVLGGAQSGWLLRIAEMILGLDLIAVGVARLTNTIPATTRVATALG